MAKYNKDPWWIFENAQIESALLLIANIVPRRKK
jgi:hypothetical protein